MARPLARPGLPQAVRRPFSPDPKERHMDDLTRIKGIGKTYAVRLAQAGFETYAALANATGEAELQKLQEAGFESGVVEMWAKEAAALVAEEAAREAEAKEEAEKDAAAQA
ncbi:MAG: hypothetical protein IH590_00240, partial [Aquamicrobium sp.]|nr:hypothetical protein [Aquamicrobium sp.]